MWKRTRKRKRKQFALGSRRTRVGLASARFGSVLLDPTRCMSASGSYRFGSVPLDSENHSTHKHTHASTFKYTQAHQSTHKYIIAHACTPKHTHAHPGTPRQTQAHPRTLKHTQFHTSTSKHIQAQGGTPRRVGSVCVGLATVRRSSLKILTEASQKNARGAFFQCTTCCGCTNAQQCICASVI